MGKRGRRQRLRPQEPQEGQEGAQPSGDSQLANWLIEQWAWGKLSPQQVQIIASLANADIHKALETKNPLQNLEKLGTLGGPSRKSGNMHRDLVAKLAHNPLQLQLFGIPLAHHGVVDQHLMLPHVLFASIYHHYPKYFFDKIMDKDLQQQWVIQVPEAQDVLRGRDLSKAIPISIHGDAVPVVGTGKSWSKSLDILSWTSMVGKGSTLDKNFIIWVVFVEMQCHTWGSRKSHFFCTFIFAKVRTTSFQLPIMSTLISLQGKINREGIFGTDHAYTILGDILPHHFWGSNFLGNASPSNNCQSTCIKLRAC